MFDGNTFFPVTGTPIRKMACMIRPLADADPVPLAVAILNAKLFILSIDIDATSFQLPASSSRSEKPVWGKRARAGSRKLEAGSHQGGSHTAASGITLPI